VTARPSGDPYTLRGIQDSQDRLQDELERLSSRYCATTPAVEVRVDRKRRRLVGVSHTGPGVGDHRWVLDVRFLTADGSLDERPLMRVIQLNPSTASANTSDSTTGKVAAWAARQGSFGGVRQLNIFAIRSRWPAYLLPLAECEIVGDDNNRWIAGEARAATPVVTAWGGSECLRERIDERVPMVLDLLGSTPLAYVGRLIDGRYPLHGLVWNHDHRNIGGGEAQLIQWSALELDQLRTRRRRGERCHG
jgi:hypothetical protein